MAQPILDTLGQIFTDIIEISSAVEEEDWIDNIEKIAPGYLELEELGSEADYDHTKFLEL